MRLLMSAEHIKSDPQTWALTRDDLVGASEIGSLLRLPHAYGSPTQIYWDKTTHADKPDALSMRIGRHFESLVVELFAEANPDLHVTAGGLYVSSQRCWQAATFDALAYRHSSKPIPVQAKTTYSFDQLDDETNMPIWGEPPHGDIPGSYLAQCLQEIDVADADEAYLPVIATGRRQPPRVYHIRRDADADNDIAIMRETGEWFHSLLMSQTPPPVDEHDATTRALKRMYARDPDDERLDAFVSKRLGARARAARASLRRAKARAKLVENELRAAMGPATLAKTRDGDVIATRSIFDQRHIKVDDLRAAHPGIAAEFTDKSRIDKLLIKQPRGQS